MTLYLETSPGSFQPWQKGLPFPNGARCDADIESLWSDDELAAVDLYRPVPADQPPAGKAVVSTSVERVMGVVKFVNVLADVPFEEQRAAKIAAVNTMVSALLSGGFTVPSGAMAGEVLQTRDSTDRINWLVSQASYSAAVAGEQGAELGAKFRTADNDTFTMSYADGLNVLLAMAAWGAACMDNSWALKDAVNAASDQSALDAIDIEAGWPS